MRSLGAILLVFGALVASACGSETSRVHGDGPPPPGAAEVAPPHYRSLDTLIARAHHVVVGSPRQVLPSRLDHDVKVPITETVFAVDETLKGAVTTQSIRVRQFAGTAGGRRSDQHPVDGLFTVGARMLLFLAPPRDGAYGLAGAGQGAFLLGAGDQGPLVFVADDGNTEQLTLAALRERVAHVPDRARPVPTPRAQPSARAEGTR